MRKLSSVALDTELNPNPPVFPPPPFFHILITFLSNRPASLRRRREPVVVDPASNEAQLICKALRFPIYQSIYNGI